MVLVESDWLFITCSGTTRLRTFCSGIGSGIRTYSMLVDEVISWLGSCCFWGLYVITSSKAMSEALSWLVSNSGSSPE